MFTISLAAFHAPYSFLILFVLLLLYFFSCGSLAKEKNIGLVFLKNVCIYYLFVSVREWSLATTARESENYILRVLGP